MKVRFAIADDTGVEAAVSFRRANKQEDAKQEEGHKKEI